MITEDAADSFLSNTRLYADPANVEGVDFARRFKRHEMLDTHRATTPGPRLSTVMAIHGGGIEPGTSELSLAIAGYRPDTLEPAAAGAPLHDYWMFEGLRSSGAVPGNGDLHVTSTHNDDPVARSLAAGSTNVLSLHGCTAARPPRRRLPGRPRPDGGRAARPRQHLRPPRRGLTRPLIWPPPGSSSGRWRADCGGCPRP
ncbi:poly-gamma-glutamate hydrolase family protein [Streptomyces erythrochromogenes]|uniref:poly-gamma-glutamate hydrolase family protein n=1 Tax=Streptomyces erythrochromogenes TaxID=285574 RepID=UPI0036A07782